MIAKILVPLDGSELAEKALPYAASLAEQYRAQLILLMVLRPFSYPAVSDHYSEAILIDYPTREERWDEARAYLAEKEAALSEKGIKVRSEVAENLAIADGIIEMAEKENIDVIVKTTHGRSGLSRWVFGNVATKVLQGAPCPIFLVRVSG